MADMGMVERVKAAIAEKFAPAIDFRAPYAKAMVDMAARAAIEALRDLPEPIAERLSWHFNNDICAGDQYQVKLLWNDALDAILKEEGNG